MDTANHEERQLQGNETKWLQLKIRSLGGFKLLVFLDAIPCGWTADPDPYASV